MKNMFKLAAVAVSMALAMGIVACSDSVDDVVDASTPEYLEAEQSSRHLESLKGRVDLVEYDQNLSDEEIKDFKDDYKAMMDIVVECEDCLKYYEEHVLDEDFYPKSKVNIYTINRLHGLKEMFDTETKYHERCVYAVAIDNAIMDLQKAKRKVNDISDIEATDGNYKLNERQRASIDAYNDAVGALKSVLNETDAKKCETKIKDAYEAIKTFNELKSVTKDNIKDLTTAVDAMVSDIAVKVYDPIIAKYPKYYRM